jgi:hypothetical protein
MADRTCAACSRTFHGRKRRYCYDCLPVHGDDPAAYMRAYMNLEYHRTKPPPKARVAREPVGPMHRPTRKNIPVFGECSWCLREFVLRGPRRRWCSPRCKKVGRWHVDTHGHADRRDLVFCRTCGTLVDGRRHGAEFCHEHRPCNKPPQRPAGLPCKFCGGPTEKSGRVQCDACIKGRKNELWHSKKYAYAKRTTAKGDYTPDGIYKRDGWRCQLCDGKVDRRLKFPHPRSPSIDHVIPIACGGTDEAANVQLAHFRCNVSKGNRVNINGEQLRLVG